MINYFNMNEFSNCKGGKKLYSINDLIGNNNCSVKKYIDKYDENEEKISMLKEDIKNLIIYISNNKEVSSINLKEGELKNTFDNIHKFIYNNVDYFYLKQNDNNIMDFIKIYGFILDGSKKTYSDIEKKIYIGGKKMIDNNDYFILKYYMYNFLENIRKEKTAKF